MIQQIPVLRSLQRKGLVADWRVVKHVGRNVWLSKAKKLNVYSIKADLDTIAVQGVEWTKGSSVLVAIEYEKLISTITRFGNKPYHEYADLVAAGVSLGLTSPKSAAIAALRIQEPFVPLKSKIALSHLNWPPYPWRYHMFWLTDNPGKSDERVFDFMEVRNTELFHIHSHMMLGSVIIFSA
jgi:hypothetical protein